MRKAKVLYKGQEAGELIQEDSGAFVFRYLPQWLENGSLPPISLTLPKNKLEYRSDHLFPFFYHMLPEGVNREIVSKALRIDKDDHFGLLLNTASNDTIGAVQLLKVGDL